MSTSADNVDQSETVAVLHVELDWGLRGSRRNVIFLFPKKLNKKATVDFLSAKRMGDSHWNWQTVKFHQPIYYTSTHGT